MAYKNEPFVKEKDGVRAPAGFHYMPNGKLMNDAHHVAMHGYIDQIITGFDLSTKDVSHTGEERVFKVNGQKEGYFSLEINDGSLYYNFYTNSWSTTYSRLEKIRIGGGYNGTITFLENTSSLKTYNVILTAETVNNIRTKHVDLVEVRNADNSINVNKSSGSNSNILNKTIYQDVEKKLYLSCIAPSLYATYQDTVDGATSSSNRVVTDNKIYTGGVKVGDLVTTTEAPIGQWTLVSKVNPDGDNEKEIELNVTESLTDGVTLTFTPGFNGVTPHSSDSTTGRSTLYTSSGGSAKGKFSITIAAPSGRLFSIKKTPTTHDLCTFKNVTFGSSALALPGENTSSSTVFYRWPVDNIIGLSNGMTLDPSRGGGGTRTLPGSYISDYETTETAQGYSEATGTIYSRNIQKEFVPGVDPYYNNITAVDRNGNATARAGNIIFNKQQVDALKADSNVRIFAHGKRDIALQNAGMLVNISNVTLEPTQLEIVTSGATSNSTTVPIANLGGSGMGVAAVTAGATISGANINAALADPTVVSKSAQTGAANIVLSAAQTLESGQTLYVGGVAQRIALKGDIEVSNFPLTDTTIYFDLERFLAAI